MSSIYLSSQLGTEQNKNQRVHNNIIGGTDYPTATTYTSDDLGNRVTETSPDKGLTTYNYDPAGNLILRTDSNGNSISSSYDELNRLQSIHYPDASQDTSFTCDQGTNGTGKLTGVTDSSGGISYQYNIFGQLLSETRVINTLSFQTSYIYNQP
ncbi:MAG: hypothetical protein COA36_13240 [Desulfotalea sp.]|nr:MAG: hypothetical protein COA36_13240 [Desulfotalea sp.]